MRSLHFQPKHLLIWGLLATAYYLAARLGLALAFEQANTSPVWPPTGIAIAGLLMFGRSAWPGVFVGAFLVNAGTGLPWAAALGVATGNTLEALVAVLLILRFTDASLFSRRIHVARFVLIMVLATTLSASLGVTSVSLAGAGQGAGFGVLWVTWWLGDLVGGLVFGSLIYAWSQPYAGSHRPADAIEVALLAFTTLVAGALMFSDWLFTDRSYPLAFLFVPLVIWAAYRFCQHGVTLLVACISLLALYGTLRGHGPFVQATEFESFLLLQAFMGLMATTGLVLAASQQERQQSSAQLEEIRQQLEHRVFQRTLALQEANMQLEEELRDRAHAADSLRSLLAATVLYTDEEFFRNCVRDLAGIYHMRFAFIGLFADDRRQSIRTLAFWDRDHFLDNLEYSLEGTPCADVMSMKIQLVTENAAELYPHDAYLREQGIDGYYGTPLVSPANELMGLVVVMDDRPLSVPPWLKPILGIYANRIAMEQARKMADKELNLAASVFDKSAEAILITDQQGSILRVNPAFERITGYGAEESIGNNPRMLQSSHHGANFYEELWRDLLAEGSWQGEIWNRRKNGDVFPVWQTITAVHDNQGQVIQYIGIFSDITEKKLSEERIFHLAHFDVLTDLPNRAAFQNHLDQAILHAQRKDGQLALLFLDLDHFKLINDTAGHPAGDELLMQVSKRIQSLLRGDDIVARLGGDEFTVLLSEMESSNAVALVAEKIIHAMGQPFQLAQDEEVIGVSIGISTYPDDGEDGATLLKNADVAMYQAKAQGRNNYQFFTREMNARAQQRRALESDMRHALENGEFLLHYQPQICIASGEIFGVEALVRWQHPEHGLISPVTFIPVAEDTGLIVPLGEWIMREACSQQKQWLDAGLPALRMAVNVSARQFMGQGLVNMVRRIVEHTGINPVMLELELTESILMDNLEQTIQVLHQLCDMRVSLAIDDFGTGYSSMAYLKRFPIHRLKIDRSFVRDLATDADDAAIVSATIAMAHNLHLTVIAEGVETEQQLQFLKDCGCEELQGYYFSKPLPADELERLILATEGQENLDRLSS